MTTHDDLEARLRASLRDRADDVATTPALYEEVQRRANRGAWLWRGVALAGAVAAVTVAVVLVPTLLPDPEFDIVDTPEDAAVPTQEDVAPSDDASSFAAAMAEAGVAWSDGTTVHLGDRQLEAAALVEDGAVDPRVTALAVEPGPASDDRLLAAVVRDDAGATTTTVVAWMPGGVDGSFGASVAGASPNGDGITFVPGDMATLAWIEGTDLHLRSFDGSFDERVQPLEGDVPDDLVAQQWVVQADAQMLLASDPDGGLWSLPMDDSNAANTGPTDPGFLLPDTENAVDALLRPDLLRVDLEVFPDGSAPAWLLAGEASPTPLPDDLASSTAVRLVGNGSWLTAVHDPVAGTGALLHLDDTGRYMPRHSWGEQEVPVTAVAPLRVEDAPASPVDAVEDDHASDASALGLPTGSPVIGTSGTDLLVRFADAEVRTLSMYPGDESEASLGRLAVLPGSTTEYGLVAVESSSEGENSIRFGGLRDGEVGPVGDVIVVDGPVTGLVWSEDGRELVWTDAAGLHVAVVDDAGDVTGEALLSDDARPVLDWVWDEVGATASGLLTVAVAGGTGVEQLGVERAADGTLDLTGPAGGSDRLVLDVHSDVGAAEDVEVVAAVGGGTAELSWVAAGNRSGSLADPGVVGGDVRVTVSGGHVLVMGGDRQVLVTFDGEVTELPTAADWDVLD